MIFLCRVACGSGVTEMEVHALLDQFKKFSQVRRCEGTVLRGREHNEKLPKAVTVSHKL